jgi:3-oxoacyl-[acyl-carrier protein] reductase
VIALNRSVAREWARFGVTVNAVAPGYVETRLTAVRSSADDPYGIPAEVPDALLRRTLAGRAGTPQDIAHAIAFFGSPNSDYITGQVLEVDGGLPHIAVTA